jgi:ribosomal protein S18 acetylase RimI-like enzyme
MPSDTSHLAGPERTAAASTLRRASQRDCAGIRALLLATWHDAYDHIMGEAAVTSACDRMFTMPQLQQAAALRGPQFMGVLEREGALAGVISIEIGLLGHAKLYMLYVHPAFQRRGTGRAFLDYTPDIFPWAHSISLEVLEPNVRAIRFYERGGFR